MRIKATGMKAIDLQQLVAAGIAATPAVAVAGS